MSEETKEYPTTAPEGDGETAKASAPEGDAEPTETTASESGTAPDEVPPTAQTEVPEAPEAAPESEAAPATAESNAAPTTPTDAAPTKKSAGTAFFAKKAVRIVLAVLCVLLVAGGICLWAYATTPGWHHIEKISYYIIPGTHAPAKGFYTIDDREYAFNDYGVLMQGFGTFAGKTYYADETGARLYGDIEIDSLPYHLDETTGEYRTGLYATEHGTIGYSDTGFPLYATVGRIDGKPYYFDAKGLMKATNHLYHVKVRGAQNITYYPLSNGVLQTGWQTLDGERYYFDPESCAMQKGVTPVGDALYLLGDDGALRTGIAMAGGDTYMADDQGIVLTGWQTPVPAAADGAQPASSAAPTEPPASGVESAAQSAAQSGEETPAATPAVTGPTYYLDPETGKMTFGHREIDGDVYFFDMQDGALVRARIVWDDTGTYWPGEDGKALTGWQEKNLRRYYFAEDGCAVTGYQTLADSKYHFSDSGVLQVGFHTIEDTLYYFGEDGIIKAGAYDYDGASRLFDADGRVLSGWHALAGVNYYYDRGVKQTGEVSIDGESYYLGSDGIMRTGWVGDYYYSSHGYPYHGAQKVDGVLHYFDKTGKMLRSTTVGLYQIDANGVAKKMAVPVGGSAASCYSFVRGYMHYASVPAGSYDEMVQYALANHRGSCYHYAALLHYVLAKSGIGANIVWGVNPQGGTHVWCTLSNGNILDACNGYYNITPEQMAARGFRW